MEPVSFSRRVQIAWHVLVDAAFAAAVEAGSDAAEHAKEAQPPERVHASGLAVLALLQREGRLVDFLEQDLTSFSDEEVGAAARVVHSGCRTALQQACEVRPVLPDAEGALVNVAPGFDAQRIRLTGNVGGTPPFRGTLKHHGWVAEAIRFPDLSQEIDPRVIAPADVELP